MHTGHQRCPPRDDEAVGQAALLVVGLQLHDHHRGRRRQVVRADHLEQVLGEPGELLVDLELHAGGEEGEALEEALDVGVGALERVEPQACRDFREVMGELATQLPQVAQLSAVVLEQASVHRHTAAPSVRRTSPSSRSSSERR